MQSVVCCIKHQSARLSSIFIVICATRESSLAEAFSVTQQQKCWGFALFFLSTHVCTYIWDWYPSRAFRPKGLIGHIRVGFAL